MRILVYRWKAYHYKDVICALEKMGHELQSFFYDIRDFDCDPEFERFMGELLENEKYDMVLSLNYFTVVSNVCEKRNVPYVSWNCDSMLISMYHQSVFHACNYIFSFDMEEVRKFRRMGVKHIFYLPLAVDVERLQGVIDGKAGAFDEENKGLSGADERLGKNGNFEKESLYESEISFVGNLYERNRYDRIEPVLPDYLRGYLDAVLWAQLQVFGGNLIQEMLTEEILLQLSDYFQLEKQEESFADLKLIFSSTVLGFKAANLERERGLNGLSLSHHVDLYTAGESGQLPLVCNRGKADYWREMPLIFHHSKINLNFTIPNIIDGTPLRVWDILGCGGFCMTSWREDLLRHFENGKDLVIFEGKDDLLRKADYYLEHEEERRKIAENGYCKVKAFHTYDHRLREMFDVLKEHKIILS